MSEKNLKNPIEADFEGSKENALAVAENVAEREKPYKLRKLCAEDIFSMLSIVKKIGIKEFKECFNKEMLENIMGSFMNGAKGKNKDANTEFAAIGIAMLPSVLDIADILLTNITKCEADFYKFLANISNLSEDEIRKLNMSDFFEMIVDVIKKEEFKDFIKVVSRLFK